MSIGDSVARIRVLRRAFGQGLLCAVAGLAASGFLLSPGAMAQPAPKIVSVSPANGATNVAFQPTIVFTFDQAMSDLLPVIPTIPGLFVGNMELSPGSVSGLDSEWSSDKRTLTVTVSDVLNPDTVYTWKLNPAGSMFLFTSETGIPLPTTTGSFTTGSGGGGGTEPVLVSSSPADTAIRVPVDADVVFVFDRPMKKVTNLTGTVDWQGIGVDAAKFTYKWSADGTTLTCEYAGDFPTQTLISWRLNPESATVLLESEEGEPLPADVYQGVFMTASGGGTCDPDGIPDTWGSYGVQKYARYAQTSTADPAPEAQSAFAFMASVFAPVAGPAVTAGSFTPPGGTQKNLDLVPMGGLLFYDDTQTTEDGLDAAYPSGNYALRFTQTGQPERAVTINIPATKPPVPKILNYTEAQSVNAGQDFTLRWNGFAGAAANDSISLVITSTNIPGGVVFQAPDLCVPRQLPVTATSIVIPANTLQSNVTYQASLSFMRVGYSSTNAIPQMAGGGGYGKSTSFKINTGAASTPGGPARFTAAHFLPNGNPQLTLTGTAGKPYAILRAKTIIGSSWTSIGVVTMDGAGTAVFEDTQVGKTPPLFYRAVAQ